jgi:hypothetical protein
VKLFASEIQPISTRATATSLAQSANCVTNFFVAFITPVLLASSSSGIYFLFGTCAFATVIVCAVFMPETRGEALEVISEGFANHKSALVDLKFIKLLRKLVSTFERMMWSDGSTSSSSAPSLSGRQEAERSAARLDILESTGEPTMSGGNGDDVGSDEVVTPVIVARSSEESIELRILAVATPA